MKNSDSKNTYDPFYFFGNSAAGKAARAVDWDQHPLGPPQGWSVSLKTTLGILFNARQAMFLFWGKTNIGFYNDAQIPILGPVRHPHVMGKTGLEIWPDVWEKFALPQINTAVMGQSTWTENQLIPLQRSSQINDGYFSYGYSPVYVEDGSVGGAIVLCVETTGKVFVERNLKENEERLKISLANELVAKQNVVDVLESMSDGFISLDKDYRVLRVNRKQELMSGLNRSQTVGKNHWDIWPQKIIPKIWDAYHKVINERVNIHIEDFNSDLNIWIAVDAFPTPENGIAAFFRDITKQKLATKILEENEAQFRTLANSIPQLAWMANSDGKVSWYNKKWFNYTGTTEKQMDSESMGKSTHPDHLERVKKGWSEALKTGLPWEDTFPIKGEDGNYRWFLSRALPIKNSSGNITGWFGTNTDIDEALKDERDLIDTLESMSDAFFAMDKSWTITRVNGHHEKIVQRKREDQIGKNLIDLYSSDPIYKNPMYLNSYRKAMTERIQVHFEDHYKPLDLWIEVRVYPKNDGGIAVFFTDIGERKRNELLLAQEKAKIDTLVSESASAIGLVRGPDLVFELVNKKWTELVSPRDYIGRTYADVYPELVGTVAHKSLAEVFKTGKPFVAKEMKISITNFAGNFEEQYYDYENVRISDSDGNPYGVYCNAQNVTEHVRSRKGVERTSENLRQALAAGQMGTWHIDLKSRVATTSSEASRIFGIEFTEGDVGIMISNLIHPEDIAEANKILKEAIRSLKPYSDKYRIVRPDGEVRWLLSQGSAMFDSETNAQAYSGIVMDITESKRAEEALRASEKNFRALFESAPGNYLVLNPDFTIVAVSDAYNVATMTKRDKILGKYIFDVFSDNPNDPNVTGVKNISASFRSVLLSKQPHTMALQKFDVKDPNGNFQEKYWSPINYPVVGSNGEVAYIIHRAEEVTDYVREQKLAGEAINPLDSSSRVASELFQRAHEIQDSNFRLQKTMKALSDSQENLKHAKEEAERANQLKSSFLANMSHEIRTPLGVMIGFADLITDTDIDPEDRKQYAQTLKRNGEQLTLLINDILDLSKVEAGHLQVEVLEFSLRSVIEDVLSAMSIKAQEKNLKLALKVDANINDKVTSDPTRLRQILFNVVGNAIKFTQTGEVALFVQHNKGLLEIEIQDTGIGIALEHQSNLFKPFVQADESMTRKFGGTGLGLALSKRLAQLLGGDLTLKNSFLGKGSIFKVTIKNNLPTIDVKKISLAEFKESPLGSGLALDGISILLVEDSADNQLLISRLLTKKGAKVEVAENGLEGVGKALSGKHDLILMDVQMPILDGYSATQRLREAGYRKPIIALTAHAMSDVRAKCLDVGYSDYLPKPIDPSSLVNTIARYAAFGTW